MITQFRLSLSAAAVVAGLAVSVAAQTPAAPAKPLSVKSPLAGSTIKKWTPPRTAWGDPDLQGNFTDIEEANTPLERSDKEFGGKNRDEITAEELAAVSKARSERNRTGYSGQPPGHWFDNNNHNSRP